MFDGTGSAIVLIWFTDDNGGKTEVMHAIWLQFVVIPDTQSDSNGGKNDIANGFLCVFMTHIITKVTMTAG